MNKREKVKLVLLFAGIIVFMAAVWIVSSLFEKKVPVASDEDFLAQNTEERPEEKREVTGTVKFDGKRYDFFHDYETYLFIGTDASGNEAGKGEDYQGSMADFLLLMVLDKTDDTYGFLQINRDTMTEITLLQKDGTGIATADLQLCTAHWYGGTQEQNCENTVDAVSNLLGGLPIDGYYSLNMDKIPELNHAVGGVTLTLLEDFTGVDSQMEKGKEIKLTDQQAFYYLHNRYGIGDEENTSRMSRQRQYMKAFLKKASQKMKEKPAFVNNLYKDLKEYAVTDIRGGQISRITNAMNRSQNAGIHQIEAEYKLGQALGDGLDHVECYLDKESLLQVMTELYGLEKRE